MFQLRWHSFDKILLLKVPVVTTLVSIISWSTRQYQVVLVAVCRKVLVIFLIRVDLQLLTVVLLDSCTYEGLGIIRKQMTVTTIKTGLRTSIATCFSIWLGSIECCTGDS